MNIFKPEVFQGARKKKDYFEGWYYKHVSADQDQVYAFIPGISLSVDDPHSFIQVINGLSGETHYVAYDKDQFTWEKNKLHIRVGGSLFTEDFIELDINEPTIKIMGTLTYQGLSKYTKSILSPGIMGWYSYIPFMECYHGIVSANHFIEGSLNINSKTVDFSRGKGYIEKDWGTSFPECWIWLQSNSFQVPDASLFISIAKIPWLGKFFMGFIAFVYLEGRYYKFATYNHSHLGKVKMKGPVLEIEMANRKYTLIARVNTKSSGELIAPQRGNMSRRIKESIDSEVEVVLCDKKGKVIFKDESKRAGLEIIDRIFDYL